MEKEFIPYKLSLRMKELGFDEKCFCLDGLGKVSHAELGFGTTPIPTWHQAFRWFRDKDFGIIDKPFYSSLDNPKVTYVLDIIDWKTGKIYKMDRKKSHEEAELACLEKLIEIVEQSES